MLRGRFALAEVTVKTDITHLKNGDTLALS